MEIISKYDVVSFDIFDTLIMRKTLTPEDVFFYSPEQDKQQYKGLGLCQQPKTGNFGEQYSKS